VVFLGTLFVIRIKPWWLLTAGFVSAVCNAFVAIYQRKQFYNPFVFPENTPQRIQTTALVGNPNDVGTYLLFPLLAAAALLFVLRGLPLAAAALTTAVLGVGMLVTETLTAIIAAGAAMIVLLIVATRRRMRVAAFIAVAVVIATMAFPPLRKRVTTVVELSRRGEFQEAASFRMPAMIACWRMFRDHPLTGVGPGCFGWWYMPYKLQLNREDPQLIRLGDNFGQAHSDHLQILATTGVLGYAIFLAAIVLLARRARRKPNDEPLSQFGHIAAPVLAAGFFVVTVAQFPLELAAPTCAALHFAAIATGLTAE
jgi:O-antigen ligase